MNIKVVKDKISTAELKELGKVFYNTMIKGVVGVQDNLIRDKMKKIINSKIHD